MPPSPNPKIKKISSPSNYLLLTKNNTHNGFMVSRVLHSIVRLAYSHAATPSRRKGIVDPADLFR